MAAYAALVSLMNLIEQIQNHPRPPITLHQEQVESLSENIAFLEDFLKAYNTCDGDQEVDRLRSRIADAAYAAEDVIESHIVDQIEARSNSKNRRETVQLIVKRFFDFVKNYITTSFQNLQKAAEDVIVNVVCQILAQSSTHDGEKIGSVDLYQGLQKVIQDMDSIKKDVMEIENNVGSPDQLQRIITTSESPSAGKSTMVGFDVVLEKVLDKLDGQQSGLQIISISGMGGIGKTTLARNVFTNPLIKYRFDDNRVWVTISQEYNIHEILLEILLHLKNQGNKESLNQKNEQDLGLQLYKYLSGRRYLIIMDDIWSVDAYDKLRRWFPNDHNGSRIVITTRMSKLGKDLDGLKMSFLNEDKSWDLFCKTVFGEQGCPDELEQIGKKIVKNCKGLPLSIVVIGGLLAKSKKSHENWKYIAENLNSVVNLDDNERCLRILRTSYNRLPIHLKPCFLHMGFFPEDERIDSSKLVKQWVAEGFLKPSNNKVLEEIAEEYLTDLIERNLILVTTDEWSGKSIFFKIHDLLRDLCQREAHKDKFLYVTSQHITPQDTSTQRRIAILGNTSNEEYHRQVLHDLKSASLARTLIIDFEEGLPSLDFRLLRVLKSLGYVKTYSTTEIFQLMNLRYIDVTSQCNPFSFSSPPIHLLWNLQTLILASTSQITIAVSDFLMMPQLRHVQVGALYLLNPCSDQMDKQDDFVMENLQTLSEVYNFRLSEEVVKRIPNVKELKITYVQDNEGFEVASHHYLNNLDCLHKLEYFMFTFSPPFGEDPHDQYPRFPLQDNMSFPNSLKELHLSRCNIDFEDINMKIGSLPFLQRLTLACSGFIGSEWETVEGKFTSLKYLTISFCYLECWTTERAHFPCLEQLFLNWSVLEIPSDFGDITTLKSIQVFVCSDSVVKSAKKIAEEQEEKGNEGLQIEAFLSKESELKELVSSCNFHVTVP